MGRRGQKKKNKKSGKDKADNPASNATNIQLYDSPQSAVASSHLPTANGHNTIDQSRSECGWTPDELEAMQAEAEGERELKTRHFEVEEACKYSKSHCIGSHNHEA
jgi:hypothetical protein